MLFLKIFLVLGIAFIIYAVIEETVVALLGGNPDYDSPFNYFCNQWVALIKQAWNNHKQQGQN